MPNLTKELVELSDFAYQRLMTRLEGLTDEEYLREPAPNSWTIRPNGDGTFTGDGGFVWDEVPPVTTIAWRVSHIIDCISAERCATGSDSSDGERARRRIPGTADRAVRC